jgi:hypothetical protein
MFDGIFFINSAINVEQLSIFDTRERFNQTCETLKSIEHYCPNSAKFIFDSSPHAVDDAYMEYISRMENTWFIDMGSHDGVKLLSLNGMRSTAETYSFMGFLAWFKEQNVVGKRIYKLSGRYTLTDNFVLNAPEYSNSFVFANALNSWMPMGSQMSSGASKLYRLRLWHMDYNLLDTFEQSLPAIFDDCSTYSIDVEHSYWKHLHSYKVVELDKIGVTGIIAPSGEYINE